MNNAGESPVMHTDELKGVKFLSNMPEFKKEESLFSATGNNQMFFFRHENFINSHEDSYACLKDELKSTFNHQSV
jgi:hypothetical protein